MQRNGFFLQSLAALVGLILCLPASEVRGQFHEAFESPTPSWVQSETDCIVPKAQWIQRRSNELAAKNRFERISFETSKGTRILLTHDMPPAFVISELQPTVRIKASRAGVRMMVRVVLPHTPSESGEGVMTTLIPGPVTRTSGQWETISFASENNDLREKLQEEIWLLRRKHGPHVTQQDAYVDKIVLNVYTAPGQNVVEIDDLRVDGIVAANAISRQVNLVGKVRRDDTIQQAGADMEIEKHDSLVVRDGTVLLVRKKPFLPLIAQSNGESFEFLKSLGFNVIEIDTTATSEQLKSARQLDLWIICPPPTSVGLSQIDFEYDRILAWSVGNQLSGRDLQNVQQRIREIRESDLREGRPIVGAATSHWTEFARQLDVQIVGLQPIGTSFLASQYSDWIRQRSRSITRSKPIWADVQTELSKPLADQIRAITNRVPPTPIEPQQLKFLVYEAITGGARGLRFRSRSRLDASDPSTKLRALTIQWINSEMSRLEPWVVGGALMGSVETTDSELEVTAINTSRSRLLLIQRPTHHEQYVAGDSPLRTVTFRDSDSTFTGRAMLIADTGLESLPNTRELSGNVIRIENCPYTAAVIVTQDPLIATKLNQTYQQPNGQQSTFQMHAELTRQWLAILQLIDKQMGRMGRSTTTASGALNEAVNAFRTANSLISNNSEQAAIEYLNRADERLAFTRREIITEPLGMFPSKSSSPLITHSSLIPLHWELASQLGSSTWNPNGLAGGDFENLGLMTQSGWENRRLDDANLTTKVELSDSDAAVIDGNYGLRMSVQAKDASQPVEATPLWISSPRIPVQRGQFVRIHGWVKIPQVIQGNPDGLMIIDSLGGVEMAERIPFTEGWQEFTLYRGVDSAGQLQVTFALTGIGEVMLDEVTIRTVDLPDPVRQAKAIE